MFVFKIFRSIGVSPSLILLSTHFYTKRELAIAEAMKHVPEDVEMQWIPGKQENDVIFHFFHRGVRYQFIVSTATLDQPVSNWSEHEMIFQDYNLTSSAALKNE